METKKFKTPGQLIEALLQEKGWTQRVLAVVLGISESALNKVVSGKQSITAELALALEEVFGVEANSRTCSGASTRRATMRRRPKLSSIAPVPLSSRFEIAVQR